MKSLRAKVADTLARVPAPLNDPRGWGHLLGMGSDDPLSLYGENATLFPIVNGLASDTASPDWHMHRLGVPGSQCPISGCEKEGVALVEDHLALRIWNQPNPFHNGQTFREAFQQHVDLAGESFWMVEYWDGTRLPKHLWLRRPSSMYEQPDVDTFLAGWWSDAGNGRKVALGLDEVLHVKMPDPDNPWRGIGPVQASMRHLGQQNAAISWNEAFFKNSARPGGVLAINGSEEDLISAIRFWRQQHQGVNNAHRIAVLNKNAKYQPIMYSHKDMEFNDMLNLSGSFIRQAFRFPKFMLGDVDDVNRAQGEASNDMYQQHLIVPRLDRIEGVLNGPYLRLFGSAGMGVEFAYQSPVQGNQELKNATAESKATVFKTLVDAGVDPADAAVQAGLPPMRMRQAAEAGQEAGSDPYDMAGAVA